MNQETEIDIAKIRARKDWRARIALQNLQQEITLCIRALDEGKVYTSNLSHDAHRADMAMGFLEGLDEVLEVVLAADKPDTTTLASEELREKDKWSYPHDEDCPKCGRRQWGTGPLTVDPMNPTDEEQSTCGACGFKDEV